MKHTIKIISIAVITTLIASCGNNTEEQHKHSKAGNHRETVETTVHHHQEKSKVQLNNGERWIANPETTEAIIRMQLLMSSFSDKELIVAYKLLKENLEKEFGTILNKCTMKGESHKQLHNYLMPMKKLFKNLESSDLNTCKENFNMLNTHLSAYKTYFK